MIVSGWQSCLVEHGDIFCDAETWKVCMCCPPKGLQSCSSDSLPVQWKVMQRWKSSSRLWKSGTVHIDFVQFLPWRYFDYIFYSMLRPFLFAGSLSLSPMPRYDVVTRIDLDDLWWYFLGLTQGFTLRFSSKQKRRIQAWVCLCACASGSVKLFWMFLNLAWILWASLPVSPTGMFCSVVRKWKQQRRNCWRNLWRRPGIFWTGKQVRF